MIHCAAYTEGKHAYKVKHRHQVECEKKAAAWCLEKTESGYFTQMYAGRVPPRRIRKARV